MKTIERIKNAFLALLKDQPLEKIKMVDISEKSGVARQTIYYHYENKEALLEDIITGLAEEFIMLMKKASEQEIEQILDSLTEPYHPIFLEFFDYGRKHCTEFLILFQLDSKIDFVQHFSTKIIEFQKRTVRYFGNAFGSKDYDLLLQMCINITRDHIMGLFQWLTYGMKPDDTMMATHHTRLWLFCILICTDSTENQWIRGKLIEKMKEKHPTDWQTYYFL